MVELNLDEKKELIDETNNMIVELNFLKLDLISLNDQISRISKIKLKFSQESKIIYKMLSDAINTKNKRVLFLLENIKKNEKILGINNTKKKNKTL